MRTLRDRNVFLKDHPRFGQINDLEKIFPLSVAKNKIKRANVIAAIIACITMRGKTNRLGFGDSTEWDFPFFFYVYYKLIKSNISLTTSALQKSLSISCRAPL